MIKRFCLPGSFDPIRALILRAEKLLMLLNILCSACISLCSRIDDWSQNEMCVVRHNHDNMKSVFLAMEI